MRFMLSSFPQMWTVREPSVPGPMKSRRGLGRAKWVGACSVCRRKDGWASGAGVTFHVAQDAVEPLRQLLRGELFAEALDHQGQAHRARMAQFHEVDALAAHELERLGQAADLEFLAQRFLVGLGQ